MNTIAVRALQAERRHLQSKITKIDRALALLGEEAPATANGKKVAKKKKGSQISEATRMRMRASQQARVARQKAEKLAKAPVSEATPLGGRENPFKTKRSGKRPDPTALLPEQIDPAGDPIDG